MLGKNLIQAASGAAGAAGGLGIEEIFSTWLFTGTGSTMTVTNGLDLAGEGGLVWIKDRTSTGTYHSLWDTERGATKYLISNTTDAQGTSANGVNQFNSDGWRQGSGAASSNFSGDAYASWTFRKAPGFFDVVTYTGNGVDPRDISHNLGSVPGSIIVKRTDVSGDNWIVYHRSVTNGYLILNSTAATSTRTDLIYQNPTSTTFRVGNNSVVNASGGTYVAYLFAHDEQIFGEGGDQSVVKCGSFTCTTTWGNFKVALGWEPQFVLYKRTDSTSNWVMLDNMRGVVGPGDLALSDSSTFFVAVTGSDDAELKANLSDAEQTQGRASLYSQGFLGSTGGGGGEQYIYIAIRRGPMKTPTSATEVFAMDTLGGTAPNPPGFNSGFPVDLGFARDRSSTGAWIWSSRLTQQKDLDSSSTRAENNNSLALFDYQNGWNSSTSVLSTYPSWMFRRAPGFFDVVAYTGNGATDGSYNVNHNLGVVPEFIIAKNRGSTSQWICHHKDLTALNYQIDLNLTNSEAQGGSSWNPQVSTFAPHYAGNPSYSANVSGNTYIAYLFATLPGISKVGSYTGTATTQQIDCGFTSGARFVLIKRTDSTGDWYVWDTARGIVSGNDPYLLLNSTAAEVTSTDYIDPYSAGFEISSTAPAAINANGGSYIFLAIA